MIELTSTPIMLMVILGVAGMAIPVINVIRKERGSSTFYGAIAFAALIISTKEILNIKSNFKSFGIVLLSF